MSGNYNSSFERRRRTKRKGQITTIIAGAVILIALLAIIIVVMSVINKDSADEQPAQPTATETVQPTLYIPTEANASTEAPTQPAVNPSTTETRPSGTTAPTETPDVTEAPTDPAPAEISGDSYTDESGVLHVFTPSGYNWTYYSDGVSVKITCQTHYDIGQYEFLITGLIPGATDFNLYYYTDEAQTTFVKIPVTVSVDSDLRVTRIA